jgi:hypothetical protein
MTSVGLEPQWYITQSVVFTTRPLARCSKPILQLIHLIFCLACIACHKMTYVGLEPQWYITQPVAFTHKTTSSLLDA